MDGQDSSGQIQIVIKKPELIEKLKERKKGELFSQERNRQIFI